MNKRQRKKRMMKSFRKLVEMRAEHEKNFVLNAIMMSKQGIKVNVTGTFSEEYKKFFDMTGVNYE